MSLDSEKIYHLISIFEDYKIADICSSEPSFSKSINVFKLSNSLAMEEKTGSESVVKKIEFAIEKPVVIQERQVKIPVKPNIEIDQKKQDDLEVVKKISKITKDLSGIEAISDVKKYLENSDLCELKSLANLTVIGDGIENARVVLIGEAPGEEEDKQGIPFCGRSGKLLDNILLSCGLSRKKNLYITNSVFWRPPANRKPSPEEISLCRPVLIRILQIINPKFVILCGGTSIESLLSDKAEKVSEMRGKFSSFTEDGLNFEYTAIYHPSYLLRSPGTKKVAWIDMMKIKNKLDDLI